MKTYGSLNEAFVESLKTLSDEHSLVKSRGSLQREILWHSIKIDDPTSKHLSEQSIMGSPAHQIRNIHQDMFLYFPTRRMCQLYFPQNMNPGKTIKLCWLIL